MLEVGQLPAAARRAVRDASASVGPYFRLRRSSSASRSSTCCSRAGDASMPSRIAAQEEREILELRLDAVARVEVRLELRVERRELANPLPDAAELREHGGVALVQRGVALRRTAARPARRSPAPDARPADRHPLRLAGGWRLERRLVELGQLKRARAPGARRLVGTGCRTRASSSAAARMRVER